MTLNPWNLSPRQVQVISTLICNGGSVRKAAQALGIRGRSVNLILQCARRRMKVASRFDVLLTWDRWVHEQQKEAA